MIVGPRGYVPVTIIQIGCTVFRFSYSCIACRYKMIDSMLWPTHELTAEQATQKIISTYHMDELVVFGKTQIFFKSPKTIYFLENEREEHLPLIVSN